MNYIVFDLEWNQSPRGNAGSHPRMPFEIIEIGAVKLNDKLDIIDDFHTLIKPKIYPKFHKMIKEILSYSEEDLKNDGIPFKEACTNFLKWCGKKCGEDFVVCTWGPSDLYYLQNNMDFYYMEKLPYPVKFYNVQQIYADKYDHGSISKLEKAVVSLGLEENEPFHTAISDARYTAAVMKQAKLGNFMDKYTFDIYRHPKRKDEEISEFHDGVLEEITMEYPSRIAAMAEPGVSTIRCVKCGRKLSKKINWFQALNSIEYGVGRCLIHGYMVSTIKIKKVGDSTDNIFLLKKTRPCQKSELEDIKRKKITVQNKKKERELKLQKK